jgi:hypothetical protein
MAEKEVFQGRGRQAIGLQRHRADPRRTRGEETRFLARLHDGRNLGGLDDDIHFKRRIDSIREPRSHMSLLFPKYSSHVVANIREQSVIHVAPIIPQMLPTFIFARYGVSSAPNCRVSK